MIYALGRPVATTRDRDGFFAHLTEGRSVLTVALPSEIAVMRKHFGLEVDARRSGRRIRADQGQEPDAAARRRSRRDRRRRPSCPQTRTFAGSG